MSETDFVAPGPDPGPGLALDPGPRPTGRRIPSVPPDPALPQIRRLLDPEAMASVFERSLRAGMQAREIRIRHLRYKPTSSVLVHYDMWVGGEQHEAVVVAARDGPVKRARHFEDALRRRPLHLRHAVARPLRYDAELEALVQWLPLDIWLPALAEPSAKLAQALRRQGLELTEPAPTPVRLSYKPRRRATLCFGGHLLKAYAKPADFEAAVSGLKASGAVDGFRTARLEAALAGLNLTVQSWVPGDPPSDARAAAPLAARMLRALHHRTVNGSLRPLTVQAQASAAIASARLVKILLPPLGTRLDALARRIDATAPDESSLVASHGDFHAGQLLLDETGEGMIDFDKACAAPPAFDLGNFAARLVGGEDGDLESAASTLDVLVDCYGRPSPGVRWSFAASILRRATSPFRYFQEDWPRRVEGMVEAADRALAR
ncbi:MAG: aminoglycoside phosphotransferase family protein [Solirubrobacteraceae bacterium]